MPWPKPQTRPTPSGPGITARAVVLGLVLVFPNTYWIGMVEGVWHSTHLTCLSLPMNLLFNLFCLTVANLLLRRLWPRRAFSAAELLAVYAMLSLATVLVSHDNLIGLMGVIPYVRHFARPENHWDTQLIPFLPSWLVVNHREAAYHFFAGHADFWATGYWREWVRPALMWSLWLFTLVGLMFCLNVLLRRRWTEDEKLSYPIIQLPLAMSYRPGFYRQPLLWVGFGLAVGIDVLQSLHHLFPYIPALNYRFTDLSLFLVNRPWNAIGLTPLHAFPLVIGFGFLLPQELAVSCWFFYLVGKAQRILGSAFGISPEAAPGFPYFPQQSGGAFLAIVFLVLWQSRGYLRQVGWRVWGGPSELDDREEALSYRSAVVGMVAGLGVLGWFSVRMGLSAWVIVAFFTLYFLLCIAVARIRAELGAPSHAIYHVNPQQMLVPLVGSENFTRRELVGLALMYWFNRFNRSHPMPQELEAFKIAETIGTSYRRMMVALVGAAAMALAAAFLIYPTLFYRHGAATVPGEVLACGDLSFGGGGLSGWLNDPRPPDWVAGQFFLVGALVAWLLHALRTRFLGWRLHPLGYALACSAAVDVYWFGLFLATLLKAGLVRYGGVRGYRRALPFFMGLILGQYLMGCLLTLIELATGRLMFQPWP